MPFLDRRDLGVTRAIEARGEPIVIRLGHRRMTQVHFPADIQQVVTAFTKPQVSLETAGPRLFLSALDPDVSGELFVTSRPAGRSRSSWSRQPRGSATSSCASCRRRPRPPPESPRRPGCRRSA
jgi:hypothetical protein